MQNGPWLRSTAIGLVLLAATLVPDRNSISFAQQVETNQYDALGRLIVTQTAGGQNNGEARSICYDVVGNRQKFRASTDASTATCVPPPPAPTPSPSPTPTPTPTPTPSNSPPSPEDDFVSLQCAVSIVVNLTANDADPEQHYPLELTGVSGLGTAVASIVSASSVLVQSGNSNGFSYFTYTVEDSLGASAQGSLSVNTYNCSGGNEP